MTDLISNFSKWMCYECDLMIHGRSETCCNCIECGKPMHFMEKVTDDYVIDPDATTISC